MTSILNLPATYHFQYNESTGLFDVYHETTLLGKSFSEEEIKWMAKQHYNKSLEK
jgi:hypothetical protein